MSQTLELELRSSESISSTENADDSNLKKKVYRIYSLAYSQAFQIYKGSFNLYLSINY